MIKKKKEELELDLEDFFAEEFFDEMDEDQVYVAS